MSWGHTNKMIAAAWSRERTDRLIDLWKAGLSASQCGAALGVTRNAVIGKVHRLKLQKRMKRVHQPRSNVWSVEAKERSKRRTEARRNRKANRPKPITTPKAAPMPEFELDVAALALPAWEALEGTMPISVLSATDSTCRWPIGDPLKTGFGYCGCPTVSGSSYCAHHKARSTQKPSGRSKDIHRVIPAFNTTHRFHLKSASPEEIEAL